MTLPVELMSRIITLAGVKKRSKAISTESYLDDNYQLTIQD